MLVLVHMHRVCMCGQRIPLWSHFSPSMFKVVSGDWSQVARFSWQVSLLVEHLAVPMELCSFRKSIYYFNNNLLPNTKRPDHHSPTNHKVT